MKQPTFRAENIIAILNAAPHGGTIDDVVSRAGVDISTSSVAKWIKDGQKDLREGKTTAYALFQEQWQLLYPGAPPKHEAARMVEIEKAFKQLNIQRDCTPRNDRQTSTPSTLCECGNQKDPKETACSNCQAIERNNNNRQPPPVDAPEQAPPGPARRPGRPARQTPAA